MIAKSLMAASAGVLLVLGVIHLVYTFSGPQLTPRDPALQVLAPMRLALAVLGGGALRRALVQDGLQSIEFVARQVLMAVHDDVAHGLAPPRGEAARLAMIECEAFFKRGSDAGSREMSVNATARSKMADKREVRCIPAIIVGAAYVMEERAQLRKLTAHVRAAG